MISISFSVHHNRLPQPPHSAATVLRTGSAEFREIEPFRGEVDVEADDLAALVEIDVKAVATSRVSVEARVFISM